MKWCRAINPDGTRCAMPAEVGAEWCSEDLPTALALRAHRRIREIVEEEIRERAAPWRASVRDADALRRAMRNAQFFLNEIGDDSDHGVEPFDPQTPGPWTS